MAGSGVWLFWRLEIPETLGFSFMPGFAQFQKKPSKKCVIFAYKLQLLLKVATYMRKLQQKKSLAAGTEVKKWTEKLGPPLGTKRQKIHPKTGTERHFLWPLYRLLNSDWRYRQSLFNNRYISPFCTEKNRYKGPKVKPKKRQKAAKKTIKTEPKPSTLWIKIEPRTNPWTKTPNHA